MLFSVKCNITNLKMTPWDLCSILGNLIDNAMEAAVQIPDNRRVSLEIKYEANQYVVYVYNNGPPITASQKKKLFQPGYTTKNSEARGYGLFLVNKLVQQHGGTIEVKSGERTSFIVYLPNRFPLTVLGHSGLKNGYSALNSARLVFLERINSFYVEFVEYQDKTCNKDFEIYRL